MHEEEKILVPELVFGHLLTGSNFDDNEIKFTGGRNGYGAKLANIFSQKFIVEIADSKNNKFYHQEWNDNMSKCLPAKIRELKKDKDYIKVSILPDYSKFKMNNGLKEEKDFLNLLYRRVYDLSACNPDLIVYLNRKRVPINSMID